MGRGSPRGSDVRLWGRSSLSCDAVGAIFGLIRTIRRVRKCRIIRLRVGLENSDQKVFAGRCQTAFSSAPLEVLDVEVPRPEFPPAGSYSCQALQTCQTLQHVGHVGALAIALGVGGAIASAGVAWADDSSDTAAGRSNDSRISAHATFIHQNGSASKKFKGQSGLTSAAAVKVSRFPLPSPHPAQTRDQLSVDRRQRKQRDQHQTQRSRGGLQSDRHRAFQRPRGPFARTCPTPAPSAIWWWPAIATFRTPKVCPE